MLLLSLENVSFLPSSLAADQRVALVFNTLDELDKNVRESVFSISKDRLLASLRSEMLKTSNKEFTGGRKAQELRA